MERMDSGKRMRSLERRYRLKQRERSNSALENGNKSQEMYSNGVEHDVLGSSLLFMNHDVLTSYEKAGELITYPLFCSSHSYNSDDYFNSFQTNIIINQKTKLL